MKGVEGDPISLHDPRKLPDTVEKEVAFIKRCHSWWDKTFLRNFPKPGEIQNVLVVTHSGCIKALTRFLLNKGDAVAANGDVASAVKEAPLRNGSITIIELHSGSKATIERFADDSHLSPALGK